MNNDDALDFIAANGGIEMRLVVPALGLCINFLREIGNAAAKVGDGTFTLQEHIDSFLEDLSEEAQNDLDGLPRNLEYFKFEKQIKEIK